MKRVEKLSEIAKIKNFNQLLGARRTRKLVKICNTLFAELEKLELGKEVKKDRLREVPPYTGFGTEEDSLTSCQGLEPRAPERDFFKFMHKDRQVLTRQNL